MPEFGQQITQGIKYIKVSKTDKEGNDRGQSLLTANTLRINYPDVGPQNYLINTAQNFADYVLLGVVSNANTSSINEILDYSFLATSASAFTIDTGTTNIFTTNRVTGYGSEIGDTPNYFNTSSGIYTFGNTPNVDLKVQISGSITFTGASTVFNISIVRPDDTRINKFTSLLSAGTHTFDFDFFLSQSGFTTIDSNQLGFCIDKGVFPSTATCNEFHVSMSLYDSSPVTATETLVTIEPSYEFQFSDYNILNGNIDIPRTSRQFLDVDYSTGVLTPTNITPIISGTATPATVQDSNYTLQRHANPRYGGSRQSSPDFNITV